MSIKIEHLNYIYSPGTAYERQALKDICLEIPHGEFVGIIGHTGSGKSTLIQHLNGLLKASSGELYFNGRNVYEEGYPMKELRSQVGLVFQYPEYQLFEETVYKDIAFGPKNMGLSPEEVDRRVREAAGFVGLTEQQLEVSPFDLSGGQKRRVAIAGVIAMEPEVLILDEPTAGLDPVGRSEILGNIQSYRKAKNATIMMVSHSMEDVARLTDRLLVMNGSKLAMDAPPAQVFTHAEELTQMGLNIPQVTQVFLELKKLGLDVKNVYTIDQAAAEIKRLKEGNRHA